MLRKSSLIALGTALALAVGCSGKNKSLVTTNGPKIEKGTQTQPQIASTDDQVALAFNEIGWMRQSAALAINPPNLSSKEGCVTRRPLKGIRFLNETFQCSRVSDASDSHPNRHMDLTGTQYYSVQGSTYEVDGTFSSHIYVMTKPETLVAQGSTTRKVQIMAPAVAADLQSSTYRTSATSTYQGDVAQDSKRQPETWKASFDGGFQAATSQPLTILTGASMTFTYTPEADVGVKRGSQVVDLIATSDIAFAVNGSCLRPVGTFTWTYGQGATTTSGIITASAAGYTRSDDGTSHPWGKRCLER